jgi:hypothetical protein
MSEKVLRPISLLDLEIYPYFNVLMFKEVYLNVTELLVLHVHPAGVGF